ncbi:nitroreductase family protein [Lyngbya sp. CCY1209]|jgi:nitroreductase|uniref:nitroreductase family protein n=1 Tax=Lyngbya sp. CCY1209 TaxID=2886103 RepID=UPI002D20D8D9|nr:nitroreductase family protein [Lyngbya sp. CCY1209]MEB3886037.1 nitroreductase family protein [Lyngbya sp. CCY1209]
MELFEAIEQRRSVKHYDPSHAMTEAEIQTLLETAILSPTSFNIQNWRFVVVRDPEIRQQIRAAAWDQAQVTEASILIILCADLKSWQKNPERYWQNAPETTRNMLVPMIGSFYDGKEQLQRDEAMRSCGMAGQTIMLTAKAMGYDSCPMIGFDPEKVAEIIKLPEDHAIAFMIAVGKAVKPASPRGGQLDLSEVVIRDSW